VKAFDSTVDDNNDEKQLGGQEKIRRLIQDLTRFISHICREVPVVKIATKFGTAVDGATQCHNTN